MEETLQQVIEEKKQILDSLRQAGYLEMLDRTAKAMAGCLQEGNKILLAGNGGSAADAQHFAAEIVGRFLMERGALPAVSLCVDPSVLTCIGNDYGYEEVFARQLSGLGKAGDMFVAISTSGNSQNLLCAIETAKEMGIHTVGLTGKGGGRLKELCEYVLDVPSFKTPRIQEVHTFSVHFLCGYIERAIFKRERKAVEI